MNGLVLKKVAPRKKVMRKFSFKVHSLKEVLSKLFPDGMIIVDAVFLSPSMLVELS